MPDSMKSFISIYLKLLAILVSYLILSILPANAQALASDTITKSVLKVSIAITGDKSDIINRRFYGLKEIVSIDEIESSSG